MGSDLRLILKLEVPVIVVLGERKIPLAEVLAIAPGGIIEIPKDADDELELRVNNRTIGSGRAVKVGENFGIQITAIGDRQSRLLASTNTSSPTVVTHSDAETSATSDADADALAEAMLAGQVG